VAGVDLLPHGYVGDMLYLRRSRQAGVGRHCDLASHNSSWKLYSSPLRRFPTSTSHSPVLRPAGEPPRPVRPTTSPTAPDRLRGGKSAAGPWDKGC